MAYKNNNHGNGHSGNNKSNRKIKKAMKRVMLLVVRMGKAGEFRDSTPCQRCMEAMKKIGIKKVAYSDDTGKIVECRVKNLITRGPSKTQQRFEDQYGHL